MFVHLFQKFKAKNHFNASIADIIADYLKHLLYTTFPRKSDIISCSGTRQEEEAAILALVYLINLQHLEA